MEVPLLSQDEFFRHLNLRSVHATSAKYHYRQCLKERLRASSQKQSLKPPGIENKKNIVKKESIQQTKSPILSPVKWLTPNKQRKMFGRPKIRSEKRKILDFDNNKLKVIKEESNNNSNQRLLESLLSNCHVLRHPGIRKEVESSIKCGPTSKNFDVKDEFWEPPSSCIQVRKCYWQKQQNSEISNSSNCTPSESPLPKNQLIVNKKSSLIKINHHNNQQKSTKFHQSHVRIQTGIQNHQERTKKERRIAAALALYHFYKPKTKEGQILSLRDFTKVFFRNGQRPWSRELLSQKSRCVNEDPLNGSNWYKNGLSVPIKKLTNTQLKSTKLQHPDLAKLNKPEIRTLGVSNEVEIVSVTPQLETVKTSYGRQSKPVLVPIKTENVRCEHCQDLFRSLYKLKRHMEKEHSDQIEKPCQKVLPIGYVPAPLHVPFNGFLKFKCDICYRKFEKRSRMIRHIKNVHSADIHRVDLTKFVLPEEFQQLHPWSLIEL